MGGESIPCDSVLGVPEGLNLFESLPVQSAVERVTYVDYRPTNQISSQNAPIAFSLGGDSRHYLDLPRSTLYVKAKLMKHDGTDLDKNELVAPSNLTLHSLFSHVDLKISGRSLSESNGLYPYKSYFKTLLTSSDQAKSSYLSAQGYYKDKGNFNKISTNSGALKRCKKFTESAEVEMEGPILEDFFCCKRNILNNTAVDIKLFRSRQEFIILSETEKKYKLEITDICFRAAYVHVNPGVIAGHSKALESANAIYPYTKVEMKSFNISSGASQFNFDNIFNNGCPTHVVMAFVDSGGFTGDFKKNCFNLEMFDLQEIELSADGQPVPSRAMNVKYDNVGREVITPYLRMQDCLSGDRENKGNGLSLEDFVNGHALFCFKTYGVKEGDVMEIKRNANMRVNGTFGSALSDPVTLVIYAEFPSQLEIDSTRNVLIY
jgi:hypothetical protein